MSPPAAASATAEPEAVGPEPLPPSCWALLCSLLGLLLLLLPLMLLLLLPRPDEEECSRNIGRAPVPGEPRSSEGIWLTA